MVVSGVVSFEPIAIASQFDIAYVTLTDSYVADIRV